MKGSILHALMITFKNYLFQPFYLKYKPEFTMVSGIISAVISMIEFFSLTHYGSIDLNPRLDNQVIGRKDSR